MPKKKQQKEDQDIVYDEAEMSGEDRVKKLREKLKQCEEEARENLDGWQRARADFVNFKKEQEEQRKKTATHTKKDILLQFLNLADSFDMAFSNKETWEKVDKNWRTGVESIYTQLLSILKSNNVIQFDPTGEVFSPDKHEAVGFKNVDDDSQDGIIVSVERKGYYFDDYILRPARVWVGQYKK